MILHLACTCSSPRTPEGVSPAPDDVADGLEVGGVGHFVLVRDGLLPLVYIFYTLYWSDW